MKKTTLLVSFMLLAIFTVGSIAKAEDIRAGIKVNTSIKAQAPGTNVQASSSANFRTKLRADYDRRVNNSENNGEYRNNMLQKASSSKPVMNPGNRPVWNSTTSTSTKNEDRKGPKRNGLDFVQAQKTHIVKQLGQSLNNLKNIRARIVTRIQKAEQGGRDMAAPKSLLISADNKITLAEQAVNALVSYNVTLNASSTVDLSKLRQLDASAIKALKDAQKALVDVVVSVAHNMGLGSSIKVKVTATSTVTSTSTNATTTVSASTTSQASSTNP